MRKTEAGEDRSFWMRIISAAPITENPGAKIFIGPITKNC